MTQAPPSFDTRSFRDALGCFPTGVCIVTAAGPVGITVNSFASVSLEPPLVLWAVARKSPRAAFFRDAGQFAIHVLAREQEALARSFAGSINTAFATEAHRLNADGVPVFDMSAAVFECRTHAIHDGGDHDIIVGRVERFSHDPAHSPLTFHQGQFSID